MSIPPACLQGAQQPLLATLPIKKTAESRRGSGVYKTML